MERHVVVTIEQPNSGSWAEASCGWVRHRGVHCRQAGPEAMAGGSGPGLYPTMGVGALGVSGRPGASGTTVAH